MIRVSGFLSHVGNINSATGPQLQPSLGICGHLESEPEMGSYAYLFTLCTSEIAFPLKKLTNSEHDVRLKSTLSEIF